MKKKENHIPMLCLLACLIFFSCDEESTNQALAEKVYPVEVNRLQRTEKVKEIAYYGMASSNILNYSFLTGGRVQAIFVNKNQFVNKGTRLMQLETQAYQLALHAAQQEEQQAKSAYEEARSYADQLDQASRTGGVAKADQTKAQLDRDIKKQMWELSKTNIQSKKDDLTQATLFAKSEGVVSDILPGVGELVAAGAETIIIQGAETFVETAISQKDLKKINTGTKALIHLENKRVEGEVTFISALPDFQTFRHVVKIRFLTDASDLNLYTGQTLKVFFQTERTTGFWLPLTAISNDGNDFVNVVEKGRLRKKMVQLMDFSGHMVRVTGLKDGEQLITKGAYSIKEGNKVKIIDDEK